MNTLLVEVFAYSKKHKKKPKLELINKKVCLKNHLFSADLFTMDINVE